MPFDPMPVETKPDVLGLDGLIAWLERQPSYITYNYQSAQSCLLCRYLHASTASVMHVLPASWTDTAGFTHPLPREIDAVSRAGDWTYGAALQRARALRFAFPEMTNDIWISSEEKR